MVSSTHTPAQHRTWRPCASLEALEQAATQAILTAAHHAIARNGSFHIALAGGCTPRNIYRRLRDSSAEWEKWHVYFGDERCLPPDHADRNSRMAFDSWLDRSAIPHAQIHIIPAELAAEEAAARYCGVLEGLVQFDLVLLGLGEDGHTASLFPGHDWGVDPEAPAALAVHGAPKPPPDRVTLSANRLSASRQALFLVSGASKRQAVQDWKADHPLPAAAIMPAEGVTILLEDALLA